MATKSLGPNSPIADSVVLRFPGTTGWLECALWLKHGGGTLIACDALQNHADGEGTSLVAGLMTSLMGFKGGVIVAPMWRRYQKVSGAGVRSAFAQVAGREFQNLVTGHGPAVVGLRIAFFERTSTEVQLRYPFSGQSPSAAKRQKR